MSVNNLKNKTIWLNLLISEILIHNVDGQYNNDSDYSDEAYCVERVFYNFINFQFILSL